MSIRQGGPTLAAVVLLGSVAIAQSSTQAPAATGKSSTSDEQVTIVGCIQRETDYRKAQDKGRGGVAGTGLGRDNEYVLINARRSEAAPGALDFTSSSSAEAYELTGNRESDLKGFVGRAVQVTGTIKGRGETGRHDRGHAAHGRIRSAGPGSATVRARRDGLQRNRHAGAGTARRNRTCGGRSTGGSAGTADAAREHAIARYPADASECPGARDACTGRRARRQAVA